MSQDPQAIQPNPSSQETRFASTDGTSPGQEVASGGQSHRAPRRGDPDVELWRGRYSGWAMFPTWLLLVLITVGAIVLGVFLSPKVSNPVTVWAVLAGILVILWGYYLILYLYRRYTVNYRVTTYRFYSEKGLIFHSVRAMEIIDIDDISLEQNLLERIVGVGRVVLRTKDASDPFFVVSGLKNPEVAFEKIDGARRDERIRRGINIA